MWKRKIIKILTNIITQPINILLMPAAIIIFLALRSYKLATNIEAIISNAEQGLKKKRGK